MSDIHDSFQKKARDHARVPMQWDSSPNAGFTTETPWMRVNEDFESWNVAAQIDDESSVCSFWKRALAVRKQYEVLIYGDFEDVSNDHLSIIAYVRTLHVSKALVLLNFKEEKFDFALPERQDGEELILVFGNYEVQESIPSTARLVHLKGYEGQLYLRK